MKHTLIAAKTGRNGKSPSQFEDIPATAGGAATGFRRSLPIIMQDARAPRLRPESPPYKDDALKTDFHCVSVRIPLEMRPQLIRLARTYGTCSSGVFVKLFKQALTVDDVDEALYRDALARITEIIDLLPRTKAE
jgi:hypothetical protein